MSKFAVFNVNAMGDIWLNIVLNFVAVGVEPTLPDSRSGVLPEFCILHTNLFTPRNMVYFFRSSSHSSHRGSYGIALCVAMSIQMKQIRKTAQTIINAVIRSPS